MGRNSKPPAGKPRQRFPVARGPQVVIQFAPDVTDEQAGEVERQLRKLLKAQRPQGDAKVQFLASVARRDHATSIVIDLLLAGEPIPVAEVYRRAKEYALLYTDEDGEVREQSIRVGEDALRQVWEPLGFTEKKVGFGGAVWLYPPGTNLPAEDEPPPQ